ncbi:phage baseplate plug family protein [Yokenella regensburgei]|uniref:phage baseplate plug family protein n=1 Tax=Yokenella regensburgei TaxID=158877 RepID=UPI003EDAC10E
MDKQLYSLSVMASIPDQSMTLNFDGAFFAVRVFFATTTNLWWLELSSVDKAVTLSQILLRPNVMHGLSGKVPGYAGSASIGMVSKRGGGVYGSIDAFAGDFGLFMADAVTV